jgi:hypothetical protein
METKLSLSNVQLNSLAKSEAGINELNKEIDRLKQIQATILELILDAHKIDLSQVRAIKGIDPVAKELIVEVKE